MGQRIPLINGNLKKCSKCGQLKIVQDFFKKGNIKYKNGDAKYTSECRICHIKKTSKYQRLAQTNDPEFYKKRYKRLNAAKGPYLRWAYSSYNGHKSIGYTLLFTPEELSMLAKNTNSCIYCYKHLDYDSTSIRERKDIPSLENLNCKKELSIFDISIACLKCNLTKQNRTIKEFFEYCENIVKNRDAIESALKLSLRP